jgi:uncharacterized membrane protein YwaF
VGGFLGDHFIYSGILYALLATLLLIFKSRIVAFILVLVSAFEVVSTLQSILNPDQEVNGRNIILAILMLVTASRALVTTIYLNGKFKVK